MSWRYRVARKKIQVPEQFRSHPFNLTEHPDLLYQYGIIEYYDGGGYSGFVSLYSDDELGNDPIQSLRWQLERMLEALDKPVLDIEEDSWT